MALCHHEQILLLLMVRLFRRLAGKVMGGGREFGGTLKVGVILLVFFFTSSICQSVGCGLAGQTCDKWFRSIRGAQIRLALAVDHVHAALYHINLQFAHMCEEAKNILAAQQAAAPQPVLPPVVAEQAASSDQAKASSAAVLELPPLPDQALLPLRALPVALPLAEPPAVSSEVSPFQVLPPPLSAAMVPTGRPQVRSSFPAVVPQKGPPSSQGPPEGGGPKAPEPAVPTVWVPPQTGEAPALDVGEFPPLPSAGNKLRGKPDQPIVLTRPSTPNPAGQVPEGAQLPQRVQAVPIVTRARNEAGPAPVQATLPKATGPAQPLQAPASEKGKKKEQAASAGDAGAVPPAVAQPTHVLSRRDRPAGDSNVAGAQPEGVSAHRPLT